MNSGKFIDETKCIFVVEQNPRRESSSSLFMMIELGLGAAKLVSVLNYDGVPITADNIYRQISGHVR